MKKFKWMLLAAAMTVLVGCGVPAVIPTEPATENRTTDPTEEILWQETETAKKYQNQQLRFWSILAEDTPEAALLHQAAAVFEAQTGAKVVLTFTDGDADALEKALTAGQADLIQMPDMKTAKNQAEFLADLTPVMPSQAAAMGFITEELGKPLCIPQVPQIHAVYYNKAAFESCGITKLPDNWADFMRVCKTLKENGWTPLTVDSRDAPVLTELLLRSKLSALQLQKLKEQGGWQDSSGAMAAAEEILEFLKAGYLATGAPGKYPQSPRDLILSDIAMVFSTNVEVVAGMQHAGTTLDVGVFPCPGSGVVLNGQMLAVAAESAHQEAAMDLVLLLTRGEFDQLSADEWSGVPMDPANASTISGAQEILSRGSIVSLGWWNPEMEEILLRIWQSKYENAEAFAAQLEQYSISVG